MKNLNVVLRKQIDFKSDVIAHCIDQDNGTLFVLKKDLKLYKTQLYDGTELIELANPLSIESIIGESRITSEEVLLFEFVVEVNCILIAIKHGHLILIPTSELTYSMYKHEREISSISLTPSQDLIALADEENNIQVMSSFDCMVLHTSNAQTNSDSLFKPVGVGWGSKETQFFGLDGRPSQEKRVDKIPLSEEELALSDKVESSENFKRFSQRQQRSTVIDWRGDGQLVATLTYLPETNKNHLKVWNRNLELQYMSEQLVTVERGLLCWIPDGKFVCCAQRRDRRVNEIALFEKNGLVRQRISLPTFLPDLYISSLAWSPNSRILAVITRQFVEKDDRIHSKQILMLFTMQNWQYYLKFSSNLTEDCDYTLGWDSSEMNRFHLMSDSGQYSLFDCSFTVTHSWNHSSIAVIDSNKILITPADICVIPPPLAALTIELSNLIYRVAYDWHSANRLLILTLDNSLIVTGTNDAQNTDYDSDRHLDMKVTTNLDLSGEKVNEMKLGIGSFAKYRLEDATSYHNLTSLRGECIGVASKTTVYGSDLVFIDADRKASGLALKVIKRFENRQVVNIQPSFEYNRLIIALDDGSFHIQDLCDMDKFETLDLKMDISESRFSYSFSEIRLTHTSESSVVTLSQDSCLRLNEKTIAFNSCSSFYCSGSYLIYTTTDNHMHFLLLENLNGNQTEQCVSWSQPIEPGATIVCAIERASRVILQMPRGNLETLHPRVLVLKRIIDLMRREEYTDACKFARRNRVNMNFLIDCLLRMTKSSEKLNQFAFTIASHDPNLLCLILTELDDSDTILDRYSEILKHIPGIKLSVDKPVNIDKVNFVCNQIKLPEKKEFLNPRLQSYLKMVPKKTDEALKIVHQLDQKDRLDAIKFLLYFVDIDQLFNDALSTYDTDITLMVASVSNKDPKQYLALLDDLNKIEDSDLRCYKIDIFVKHYDMAFEHLFNYMCKTPSDKEKIQEQLIELVTSKRIYKSAIALLCSRNDDQPDLIEAVWAKYASYLMDKRYFNEAGLAFSKASNVRNNQKFFDLALACYAFVEEWEPSMALIARSQVDEGRKAESLEKIVNQLMGRSKYAEAILVLQYPNLQSMTAAYLSDLIQKRGWYLAESLVLSTGDKLMIQTVRTDIAKSVKDAVSSHFDTCTSEFQTAKSQLDRLKLLLTTCRVDPAQSRMERGGFVSDSLSTVDGSEMSSVLSGGSGNQQRVARSGATSIKTRSSTKSSKPHQKRIKLQEGSRYEDRAIVLELKKFLTKQKSNQEVSVSLAGAMFEYCDHDLAVEETKKMNNLLKDCLIFSQATTEILWPHSPNLDQTFSLYVKMGNSLTSGDEGGTIIESVDLEVLMKPTLPSSAHIFEI